MWRLIGLHTWRAEYNPTHSIYSTQSCQEANLRFQRLEIALNIRLSLQKYIVYSEKYPKEYLGLSIYYYTVYKT